jgi:hypothetical protein
MKKFLLVSFAFLITLVSAVGQDFKFPEGPVVPLPLPPAPSSFVVKPSQHYILESADDFFIRVSPSNRATFIKETGPITYKGEFPDAPGIIQKRTFKGPFLAELNIISSGDIEIFRIPIGVKEDKFIVSTVITLSSNNITPPDPTPKPGTKNFWVIIVEETSNRTPEIAAVVGDITYFNSLKTLGHDFRPYDKDSVIGANYAAKAKEKNVGLPAIFLVEINNSNTKVEPVTVQPLPKTTALITQLIKNNGGK